MVTYLNTTPTTPVDGVPYATATLLTGTEVDVFNQPAPAYGPVPAPFAEAVLAIASLVLTGAPASGTTYIVLQTDMGDGNWADVAWITTTAVTTPQIFALSAGVAGSNGFAQSRAVGTGPASNGSNQIPLGGRFRFVAKTSLSGGTNPTALLSIKYKLLGLR